MTALLWVTFAISLASAFLIGLHAGMAFVIKRHLIPLKKEHKVANQLLKEASKAIGKMMDEQTPPTEGGGDIVSPIQIRIK